MLSLYSILCLSPFPFYHYSCFGLIYILTYFPIPMFVFTSIYIFIVIVIFLFLLIMLSLSLFLYLLLSPYLFLLLFQLQLYISYSPFLYFHIIIIILVFLLGSFLSLFLISFILNKNTYISITPRDFLLVLFDSINAQYFN